MEKCSNLLKETPKRVQEATIYALYVYPKSFTRIIKTHLEGGEEKLGGPNDRLPSFEFWVNEALESQGELLQAILASIEEVGLERTRQMAHSLQPDFYDHVRYMN
jgi:hypothetical protein